jgi:hypothetical protein
MKASYCRRKGIEFERAVRRSLAVVFGEEFVQRELRQANAPDVIAPGLLVECKAGRFPNLRKALRQAVRVSTIRNGVPVAVCKDDRRRPLVTMRFEDFLMLVRAWHGQRIR